VLATPSKQPPLKFAAGTPQNVQAAVVEKSASGRSDGVTQISTIRNSRAASIEREMYWYKLKKLVTMVS